MNKTIILLMLLLNYELINAQQYNFSNVGTNKGLPSSECYGLLQDSKGYMWVRTLNGLCKFNGKKFKAFTKRDGLKSNAIYALYEDKKQRIWFATSTSHIGYIQNDSIYYLPSSERFAKENGYGQKVFYQFVADKDLNIYVSSHERAYKFIEKDSYKSYILLTQDDYFLKIIDINHQTFCIPDTVAKIRKLENRKFNISVFGNNININWDETTTNQGIIRVTYPCIDKNGNVFFQISNRLFCIYKQGVHNEIVFESLIYHTFLDKENNLWIGLNSGGLVMYPNADITRKPQHLLKDETISGISQDFEGGIWVSSLNKGLFYCKNLFNENLINSVYFNYKPEMLKIIDSSLFISDFKSSVVQFNIPNAKILSKKITVEQSQIGILDIDPLPLPEGFLLSGRNSLYRVDKQFNFLRRELWEKKLKLSSGAYNTIVTSTGQIIGISKNYITNYTKGYSYNLPSFGNDIIEFQNDIFIATKNGLLKYNETDSNRFELLVENENVIKLLKLNQELLAVCRDGKVFRLNDKLNQKQILIGNASLNDACIYAKDSLIIASNSGIYFLNISTNKIQLINSSDGILDNEVFKIAAYKQRAFYSTIYGLGSFDISKVKQNLVPPRAVLTQVIDDENQLFVKEKEYNYNSSFAFKFELISFKDDAPLKLYYKLDGYNKEWKSNESGEVNYTNLPKGNYDLMVYAQNNAGIRSEIKHLPFSIATPFFQTWWFILLLIALLVLLAYVIYRITYFFINKREVNKTRINKMLAEYQLMGLKAQMNPHFIFNCLNSIQKYVLDHDSKQAYTYMAKFSKLIRFVLDISDKTFVALSDELALVKLYAELEQLRFDKKFNFTVEVNENIDPDDVFVPSLLIQPYLENAIWHGIMNLSADKKGEVKINVKALNETIEITIVDNGIGRKKSKLLNQNTHQSKGLSINQKRIEAINYLLKSHNASVALTDLYDQNNEPNGTMVIIKLPLKYDE